MDSRLLGVTYSEFDNEMGTQLRYQYPDERLGQESFETLSEYVIVDKKLSNRVITVRQKTFQFANYSVAIEDAKYHRNTLFFSLGLVLAPDADVKPFEIVLRKTASMLRALEEESEFLYRAQIGESDELEDLVRALYTQLSATGQAFLQINPANVLFLQVFERANEPPPIHNWQVPLLLFHRVLLTKLPWESTLNHLLPFIDGVRSVQAISADAGVDIDLVRKAVRILVFYNIVFITDVIKFSNRYQATSKINYIQTDEGMRHFEGMLLGDGIWSSYSGDASATPPSFNAPTVASSASSTSASVTSTAADSKRRRTLSPQRAYAVRFILYTLRPGTCVSDLCTALIEARVDISGLDVARLLAIAVHMGLIQRIYDYPVSPHAIEHEFSSRLLRGGVHGHREGSTGGKSHDPSAMSESMHGGRLGPSLGGDVGSQSPMEWSDFLDQNPSFQDLCSLERGGYGESYRNSPAIEQDLEGVGSGTGNSCEPHSAVTARSLLDGNAMQYMQMHSSYRSEYDVPEFARVAGREVGEAALVEVLSRYADGSRHLDQLGCELRVNPACLPKLPGLVYIRR